MAVNIFNKQELVDRGVPESYLNSACVIFLTIELPTINDDNFDEWVWRFKFLERIGWNLLVNNDGSPNFPGVEWLKLFHGMRTNVAPKTRKVWVKKTIELLEWDVDNMLQKQANSEDSDDTVINL